MEDGPAEDAGIQAGDIITRVEGRSLFEPLGGDAESDFDLDASVPVQRLLAIARELDPGESITVEYLRNGEARRATLEVQDLSRAWGVEVREAIRPQMEQLREQLREQRFDLDRFRLELPDVDVPVRVFERERAIQGLGVGRYGLGLTELTPGLADYFGAEQGVLVSDVDEDSALGLEPGDVILRIGDREVTTLAGVRRILGSYTADEQVTVRVRRRGAEVDVLGRLGG
jgi:S1-C subfamily serine protease